MVVAGSEIGRGNVEVAARQVEATNTAGCRVGDGWSDDVEMSGAPRHDRGGLRDTAVFGVPDLLTAIGHDAVGGDEAPAGAHAQHVRIDALADLDELAQTCRWDRVAHALPLDERQRPMDPASLDVVGVEALAAASPPRSRPRSRSARRARAWVLRWNRRWTRSSIQDRAERFNASMSAGTPVTTSSSRKLSPRSRNGRSILPLRSGLRPDTPSSRCHGSGRTRSLVGAA